MHTGYFKPNTTINITVPSQGRELRLDKFLAIQFPLYSRTYFATLIGKNCVRINGKKTTKPSTLVIENDLIEIHIPPKRSIEQHLLEKKSHAIEIIDTQEHFLIVYKPAHLLVHQPSNTSTEPTLVDWLVQNFDEIQHVGYIDRPGIVHRLDKDTSGLLIIPRTQFAHKIFGELFRERAINKTYFAIVEGHPPASGIIKKYIGRDPVTRTKMIASDEKISRTKMRDAQTLFRVMEYFDEHALLEVKPITGRTHQIRIHLASIGYPIMGDIVYGKKSTLINRQALHAAQLAFQFGDKKYLFTKDIPEDMKRVIKNLQNR